MDSHAGTGRPRPGIEISYYRTEAPVVRTRLRRSGARCRRPRGGEHRGRAWPVYDRGRSRCLSSQRGGQARAHSPPQRLHGRADAACRSCQAGRRRDQPEGPGPDDVPRQPDALVLRRTARSRGGRRASSGAIRATAACARARRDETGPQTWCGVGWTGQPNVIPKHRAGAGATVRRLRRALPLPRRATGPPSGPTLRTGDLAKGSATSDPDGYPLYYAGSRDNKLRIVALDRRPADRALVARRHTSVPYVVWNNDWDGAPARRGRLPARGRRELLVLRDPAQPRYDRTGKVRVRPEIVSRVPGWDGRLLADPRRPRLLDRVLGLRSTAVSRSSRTRPGSYRAGTSATSSAAEAATPRVPLLDGRRHRRVGRDRRAGYLYVASELEKFDERSRARSAS